MVALDLLEEGNNREFSEPDGNQGEELIEPSE
jgi:hypothetical protein